MAKKLSWEKCFVTWITKVSKKCSWGKCQKNNNLNNKILYESSWRIFCLLCQGRVKSNFKMHQFKAFFFFVLQVLWLLTRSKQVLVTKHQMAKQWWQILGVTASKNTHQEESLVSCLAYLFTPSLSFDWHYLQATTFKFHDHPYIY